MLKSAKNMAKVQAQNISQAEKDTNKLEDSPAKKYLTGVLEEIKKGNGSKINPTDFIDKINSFK